MKKISLVFLLLLLTVTLGACDEPELIELDYSDFPEHLLSTFSDAETIEDERYIVYYYGKNCGHCLDVKQEILNFFLDFTLVPFYILEVQDTPDTSGLEEFLGTPTVFLMADGQVLDSYIGSDKVRDFILTYEDIESIPLDYTHFESQHLSTYQEALDIDSEAYLIYYYLEDCPHCIAAKDDFLEWAFERDLRDIYFMNGAEISQDETLPTELIILNSGTPILVVMTNGNFADEYYSGTVPVLEYIGLIGDGDITTNNYVD